MVGPVSWLLILFRVSADASPLLSIYDPNIPGLPAVRQVGCHHELDLIYVYQDGPPGLSAGVAPNLTINSIVV